MNALDEARECLAELAERGFTVFRSAVVRELIAMLEDKDREIDELLARIASLEAMGGRR